ncbi:MAG: hypothetical protein KJ065_28540, partial [Anaerolineae bacterium]|nr:hypothetical protein [Anaerolineae bacterium]
MQANQGLSEREVSARRQRGEGNQRARSASRSYWSILSANLFNFFNIILFAVGVILVLFGRYNDAVITVITALISTLLRTFQEVRAKRQLDQIALLVRPSATVLRASQDSAVSRISRPVPPTRPASSSASRTSLRISPAVKPESKAPERI